MPKNAGSIGEIRKKITKTHELISTSYHEAGHVIYALLNMMFVSSATIYEDKKYKRVYGITYYDPPKSHDLIEDPELLTMLVEAEIGLNYAGLVAEKFLFKSISGSLQTPMFIRDGSSFDNKAAAALIKKYDLAPAGRKRYLYKQKIIRKTQSALHKNWNAVMIISHALFKQHNLSFEDLRELLTKKTNNKIFWKEQFKKICAHYDNNKNCLDEKDLKIMLSND